MSFLWPGHLWLLWALPLLPLLYVTLLRRRRGALRYSRVDLARAAAGPSWRRHLVAALLWLACAVLLVAAARPSLKLTLPWSRSTILLAIDVSLSMRVADVLPTRMVAAQTAAKTFIEELPRDIDVGLVTFAGSAQIVQRPTGDRAALVAAIDAFQMQYGTAIGSAIVLCLAELFPEQHIDLTAMTYGARPGLRGRDGKAASAPAVPKPVEPGSYTGASIVLLSDGRRTTGVDTLEAAKMAAERGVRIDVIGLGTVEGAVSSGEGFAIYLQLDEPTLKEVARMTGGEYHYAGTAEQLKNVYQRLGSRPQSQTRETEIAPMLALVAALLVVGAMVPALRRSAA